MSSQTTPSERTTPRESRVADAIANFPLLPDEAGVRLPAAIALLGCSAATVWRLVKTGRLITVKPSARTTLFLVGSIRALLTGVI